MRNRALHDALHSFSLEAASLLTADTEAGFELEFALEDEGSSNGPALYRYRPLTDRYIGERWHRLRDLPGCAPAGITLGAGAKRYLRVNGLAGEEAEPALRAMLERLYEDSTGFRFPEERFERVYSEVEATLYEESLGALVIGALPGLELESERVELGHGLALATPGVVDAPTEFAVVLLERSLGATDELPLDEAADLFTRLVTNLRVFKPGGVTVASLGWARAADGPWRPIELDPAGAARGESWRLRAVEEDSLREFVAAADRSPHRHRIAWPLARFEMGCARPLEAEALSDHLLALRALLDAGDEPGRAGMALRLAALCAEEGERRALQRRLELADALERSFMAGAGGEGLPTTGGSESPRSLAAELEEHVRALLRDVLCGYLEPDLRAAADDILLETSEPIEIEARDIRDDPDPAPDPDFDPPTERAPRFTPSTEHRAPSTGSRSEPEGVTPSADWTDFSAPV